jgi:hypothetical protein
VPEIVVVPTPGRGFPRAGVPVDDKQQLTAHGGVPADPPTGVQAQAGQPTIPDPAEMTYRESHAGEIRHRPARGSTKINKLHAGEANQPPRMLHINAWGARSSTARRATVSASG